MWQFYCNKCSCYYDAAKPPKCWKSKSPEIMKIKSATKGEKPLSKVSFLSPLYTGLYTGLYAGLSLLVPLALFIFPVSVQAGQDDLLGLYSSAERKNPTILAARARLEAASALKPLARAGLLPALTAQAGYNRFEKRISGMTPKDIDESYWGESYSVSLTQPLFNPQAWVELDMAEKEILAAQAEVAAAEQELIYRVSRAYFSVLLRASELDVAKKRLELFETALARARLALETGSGDIISVREAQAARDRARSLLLAAKTALSVARQELRVLVHRDFEDLADLGDITPLGPMPDRVDEWIDAALKGQPLLIEARNRHEASRQKVEYERRARWPRVDLRADASYTDGSFLPEVIYRDVHGGLFVSIPFYLGGSIGAKTQRAEAEAVEARHRMEEIEDGIRVETRRAFCALKDSVARLDAARAALASAKTSMEATEEGLDVGTRTIVDLLAMTEQYLDAQKEFFRARYEHVIARLALKKAAGTLGRQDLEAVNGLLVSKSEGAR